MKTVAFVMPPVLPVPCVKGGAIETLVQFLIDENEKKGVFYFLVFTVWDELAEKESRKYKYTEFVFIDINTKSYKIKYQVSRIARKVMGKRPIFLDEYHSKVYLEIRKRKVDFCIAEGGSIISEFEAISKFIGREKMAIHIHANFYPPKGTEKIFANVLAISDFVANTWASNSTSDIFVLKNCISDAFFQVCSEDSKQKLRKSLNFCEEDYVLLFCGRLVPEKGVKELILAVKKIPQVKLLIIGRTETNTKKQIQYKIELDEIICNTDNVTALPYIDNKELPVYYQSVDALVVPSMCEEGAGMVVVEGMASGKPIILTQSGGMREYISDEGCYVVQRKDMEQELRKAILSLEKSKEFGKLMGQKNKIDAAQYTQESYYKNFVTYMERKLNG